MRTIDLKVGYSCNDACLHCVVDDFRDALRCHDEKQDKSTEEIFVELADARSRGDVVTLTGGEPTIRRDFVEIVRRAKELGYVIQLQTNGRRLSDRAFLQRIIEQDPEMRYVVALHGHKAELHDAVTQRPGSFAETSQGLRNLCQAQQRLVTKIVLSRLNFRHMREICAYMYELGSRSICLTFPHAQGRARKLWEQVVPRYREIKPYLHEAMDYCCRMSVRLSTEAIPFCLMRGFVRYNGELLQSDDYAEINQYGDGSGVQDWRKVRTVIKSKFDQCLCCRFFSVCEGPWIEYATRYGGQEFYPVFGHCVRSKLELLQGDNDGFACARFCLP